MESRKKRRVQGSLGIRGCGAGENPLKSIRIKGFQGTSLLDFPGRVASLVFTGGCNLTCPFCHNGELVLKAELFPDIPVDELLADLEKRSKFIDGVVVSGGEPTIDPGLPAFLAELKARQLLVKLDTNGLCPEVLARLLEANLLDCVALDLKTSPCRYSELHTSSVDGSLLRETVALLKQSGIEVEYRTTCIPKLVSETEIDEIGALISGAQLWVLQQYGAKHAMDEQWRQIDPYSRDNLLALAARATPYVKQVQLRGL